MITNLGLGLLFFLSNSVLSDHYVAGRKGIYIEYVPPQSTSGDQGQKEEPVIKMRRQDSNEEIKTILEENYKFKNDESAKRFRVATEKKEGNPTRLMSTEPRFAGFLFLGSLPFGHLQIPNEPNLPLQLPVLLHINRSMGSQLFAEIAKRLVNVTGDRRAGGFLAQRISIAIQRGNAASILEKLSDETGTMSWVFRAFAVRRIVGGMETSISMYPYNVAISRNGRHWCGGSIIDEQWVLTAGHCFESAHDNDKKKLNAFIIRAGSSFHNRGGYQARVNKAFFPAKYAPGNADYDFSLVRLDRPMPIGRNIAVLNLPSDEYVIKPGDMLIVTGWGSTHETGAGHIPDRLRFVPVPAMRLAECQSAYRFYITPRMMCAGYATGGKDACNHDSGGPAVRNGVLLGIVSFGGKQCGDPHSPGVYSRVSEMTWWVEETVANNEASSVPELQDKIKRAREREQDLQRFKARVEDKKNQIKNWLRETLKSPSFIELAKKKLTEAQAMRRSFSSSLSEDQDLTALDDSVMDDINLSNLIHDRILQGEDGNEDENMLSTLALRDIMLNESKGEKAKDGFKELLAFVSRDDPGPPLGNVTNH